MKFNPMNYPPIIAFTGERNVGKTTAAKKLVEDYGYVRVHAFEGGKVAALHWFAYVVTGHEAHPYAYADRMVNGDLKDKPSPYLPYGHSPRYFMEYFGKFMGVDMGVPWTLAMEIDRAKRIHGDDVRMVIESVVYEADEVWNNNGVVWRLVRPGFKAPKGHHTDETQRKIKEDTALVASTVEALLTGIDDLMAIYAFETAKAFRYKE